MFEISICPDPTTGQERTLCYDEHGYHVRMRDQVTLCRELDAVCYLVSAQAREHISLIHGLQDAGEFRMAEWFEQHRHIRT